MTPAAILTALKAALVASSDLSYVDDSYIFIGKRGNVANFPAIVLEPGPDKIVKQVYPDEERVQVILVGGAIKVYDEDKQLVGDVNVKGVADFMNDVKKALSADHTLGGACINLTVGDGQYDSGEDYPLRGFQISVEVLYRQNRLTRA
jgi:hypothetical protein